MSSWEKSSLLLSKSFPSGKTLLCVVLVQFSLCFTHTSLVTVLALMVVVSARLVQLFGFCLRLLQRMLGRLEWTVTSFLPILQESQVPCPVRLA